MQLRAKIHVQQNQDNYYTYQDLKNAAATYPAHQFLRTVTNLKLL
jgi:hypothetical protein